MPQDEAFLEGVTEERSAANLAFPAMVEAATERRRMLRELADERKRQGVTQAQVAAAIGTSQSAVACIESGRSDLKLSSVERYAASLGRWLTWQMVDGKAK